MTDGDKTMSNIDYLASGYNIFKGDPRANNVDPGFVG
jgi:hypothetical protein